MPALRPFDPVEQRVIGCLVEKELSTPDAYPLTLNALVAACNQASNREPVSRLAASDVEGALHRLMADLLVWRARGARALRWMHRLDDKLSLRERGSKAILAELLLRGAQTPGELRARSPRMHAFGALGEVEEALAALAGRGLVEELPRQPGQKERRWRHLLGSGGAPAAAAREVEARDVVVEPPALCGTQPEEAPKGPAAPAVTEGGKAASAGAGDLLARVEALERRVEELAATIARLAG
ncbi:MAG: DUF480 domain-containing protein [bacterium]